MIIDFDKCCVRDVWYPKFVLIRVRVGVRAYVAAHVDYDQALTRAKTESELVATLRTLHTLHKQMQPTST